MPILAMGRDGKLYVTSGHSTVGTGYGYTPEVVEEGDLTLGSAYLKSQSHRRHELLKNHANQSRMDQMDAGIQRAKNIQAQQARIRRQKEARMLENPDLQTALKRKALAMGCDCNYSTPIDGNVLSANGMDGFNGMGRDQQAIHHAVTGRGRNVAHRVDPIEMQQAQMRADAQRIMHLKARR